MHSYFLLTPGALLRLIAVALLTCFLPELAVAAAAVGGLDTATSTAEDLRDWMWLLIPIVCVIAGAIAGVAYSFDLIRKDTLYQFIVGVVFAGAIVGGIIDLVF